MGRKGSSLVSQKYRCLTCPANRDREGHKQSKPNRLRSYSYWIYIAEVFCFEFLFTMQPSEVQMCQFSAPFAAPTSSQGQRTQSPC